MERCSFEEVNIADGSIKIKTDRHFRFQLQNVLELNSPLNLITLQLGSSILLLFFCLSS